MKKLVIGLVIVVIGYVFAIVNRNISAQGEQPTPLPLEGSKPALTELPPEGPAPQLMVLPTQAAQSPTDQAVEQAFLQAAEQGKTTLLGLAIYTPVVNHIQYAQDGSTALVWIALKDPETGQIIATEPGLSIERLDQPDAPQQPESWSVILQSNPSFLDQVRALPPDLLTDEISRRFLDAGEQEVVTSAAAAFTGYKLPWTAGVSKRLSGSIGHFLIYNSCSVTSCRYAYDYADGTMFPLIASKGGVVKSFKWTCYNGTEDCTNFLILEDQSTIPTSYQIYYHMAFNSIPARLRVVGAQVLQGEYIGDVDDTGYSSGHHLHYHVYTTPKYSDWSWGNSVDFTYDDVPINGGHPRTCYESTNWPTYGTECNAGKDGKRGTSDDDWYVSGNTPAHPPTGTWDSPADQLQLTTRTVGFSGTAADDIQIVRIQAVVNYDGTWKPAGDLTYNADGTYSGNIDLCAASVPDGPFAMSVRIYDREGSQAQGLPVRQFIKNYACAGAQPSPSSKCAPNDNQVALYAESDYRGACQNFTVSASGYPASLLTTIGDNNAASIQVGKSVQALVYDRSSDVTSAVVSGRVETFETNDPSLSDNRIGLDHISGLWVQARSMAPDEPFINPLGNRFDGSVKPTSADSLVLSWKGGAGGTIFDVTLLKGTASVLQTSTTNHYLSIGSLPAGTYTLTVKARSAGGANTSDATTFTVDPAAPFTAAPVPVPYQTSFDTNDSAWTGTGLWHFASKEIGGRALTNAWIYNNGAEYQDPTWKAGDLTSPPISLPAGVTSYLRFAYFVGVEDDQPFWDQRRVQIAIGDGAFADLVQLSEDKQQSQAWINSGPISLAGYAGLTVRLRFHFDALDSDYNNYPGWLIDDISVNTTGTDVSCADGDANPASIPTITAGAPVSGVICPEGDVDLFKFSATAGQSLVADIDARTLVPSSSLDSHIYLLDADRSSVLAENDDEKYNTLIDSLMPFTITRSGTYYLKVKAWNHPGVGGPTFKYNLTLKTQPSSAPPSAVAITYPTSRVTVPGIPFFITASAQDYDGGNVAAMEFYWHGPDWSNPAWVKLGVDNTPGDGWKMAVQPAAYGGVKGAALYVQAVSRSGATAGVVWRDLQLDTSPPSSQMLPLPPTTFSTVVNVQWSANDPTGNLGSFDLQYQINQGAWQNYTRPLTAGMTSTWVELPAGATVGFRMRAVDLAGNVEAYPDTAEAVTKIAPTCSPDENEISGQSLAAAVPLTYNQPSASYSLCASAQTGPGDVDWLTFDAQKGQNLMLVALPAGGAHLVLNIYSGSPTTLMLAGSWQSPDYNRPAVAYWTVPASGKYYVEIKAVHPEMFGTDMRYRVWVGEAHRYSLPIIGR